MGVTLQVGASVGVARFPQDGVDAAALLAHADQAMYAAKQHRREAAAAPSPDAS